MIEDVPQDCENCDGAGWFETEDDAFRCMTCDGTGTKPSEDVTS